jgi:hypothetical protein
MSDKPVSVAIVEAVAASEGVDPHALPEPLQDYVDVDALNRLSAERSCRISFVYFEYRVTVTAGECVTVTPLQDG